METTFKDYPIYKKRDGKGFKEVGRIYSISFEDAKKEFAQNIANDLQNTCDVVYLTKKDGASEEGFYNLSFGRPIYDEEAEKYDTESLKDSFLVSQSAIDEGFECWSEDVYTWELREPIEEEDEE